MKNKDEELKILYISSVCSEEVYNSLQNKIIIPMQYSIQKFHNLIIKGINKNENCQIKVLSGIPVNRKKTKKIFFRNKITYSDNVEFIHIGFINLPVIKQVLISVGMALNLLKWNYKNRKNSNKIIVCDASYVTVNPIIIFLSKVFKVKKIAIVADIYSYMSEKLIKRENIGLVKKIITKLCKYCWNNYDGYVLLTEKMNDIVNENNKPYIIMEGISEKKTQELNEFKKENYIMYARRTS